jgi:hypothetical protein
VKNACFSNSRFRIHPHNIMSSSNPFKTPSSKTKKSKSHPEDNPAWSFVGWIKGYLRVRQTPHPAARLRHCLWLLREAWLGHSVGAYNRRDSAPANHQVATFQGNTSSLTPNPDVTASHPIPLATIVTPPSALDSLPTPSARPFLEHPAHQFDKSTDLHRSE